MPRSDNDGRQYVVTDPAAPLAATATVSNEVEIKNASGDPIPVSGSVTITNPEAAPVPVNVVAGEIALTAGDITIGDVAIASIAPGDNNIGNVDVASLPSIPAGTNNIGKVNVEAALPAGDNNIGNVDVVSLPAIPAGTNKIGSVDLASALPAGTNNIGDVDVLSLPALPAGNNNIGDVDVASLPSLPAGSNAIGTVGVTSLPALPTGSNTIGSVNVATLPSLPAGSANIGDVDVLTLPSIPAGDNNIGNVDVVTLPPLPAGTNNIGDVDVASLPSLPAGSNSIGSVYLDSFPHGNLGAFGDLETAELRPLLQLSFATGIRDQLLTSSTANGGTVDSNAGRLRLQTGTNAAGSAIAYSVKPASYRPGQGITARFTPFWAGGAANSTQIAGMGNTVDGYFFGYNGTAFGILHRLNSEDNWVAQSAWNGDKCNGTGPSGFNADWSKGNVLQVKYPYLGHGNIRFYVLNPATSLWILAHTIRYTGSSATPQLTNPCLGFHAHAANAGNTSNLISYVTCAAVFVDGEPRYLGPQFGAESTKNSITTETNILSLRNATTINGVPNRGLIRLRQIVIATDGGNGIATLRVKRAVTLGGSPVYSPVSGSTADSGVTLTSAQSTASFDVAGTTVTGGTTVYNAAAARNSHALIDLTPFEIFIAPGETLTFSAASAASASISVAVNWNEDVQ